MKKFVTSAELRHFGYRTFLILALASGADLSFENSKSSGLLKPQVKYSYFFLVISISLQYVIHHVPILTL
jgi:hypothetical protein